MSLVAKGTPFILTETLDLEKNSANRGWGATRIRRILTKYIYVRHHSGGALNVPAHSKCQSSDFPLALSSSYLSDST